MTGYGALLERRYRTRYHPHNIDDRMTVQQGYVNSTTYSQHHNSPVEEGLSPEHGRELLRHALPHLLDGGGVADEGGGHLEPLRRDVADGGLDVVGDPLHEVRRVLVDDVQHLCVVFRGECSLQIERARAALDAPEERGHANPPKQQTACFASGV